MPLYPKYTTTVIGAYSVPRWYESLDRLITLGQLQPADMADAQFWTMQASVLEQEIAGIDIVTGGEAHRRPHNRHSPPNAMLNQFLAKDSVAPGNHPTEADYEIRSKRHASRSDVHWTDFKFDRPRACRRIQNGF